MDNFGFGDKVEDAIAKKAKRNAEQQRAARATTAKYMFQCLRDRLEEFQDSLEPDKEVGVVVTQLGERLSFHLHELSYESPSLVVLKGENSGGNPIELAQHPMQVRVLFKAVEPLDQDNPTRIGFRRNEDKDGE
jgi:hypothetical protein